MRLPMWAGGAGVVAGLLALTLTGATGCGGDPAAQGAPAPGARVVGPLTLAAPVLGVVVDARLQVLHVEPWHAGALAGIQRGDELMSLGTETPRSAEDAKRLFRQVAPGDTLPITVRRGGREVGLTVRVGAVDEARRREAQASRPPATPTWVPFELAYF